MLRSRSGSVSVRKSFERAGGGEQGKVLYFVNSNKITLRQTFWVFWLDKLLFIYTVHVTTEYRINFRWCNFSPFITWKQFSPVLNSPTHSCVLKRYNMRHWKSPIELTKAKGAKIKPGDYFPVFSDCMILL